MVDIMGRKRTNCSNYSGKEQRHRQRQQLRLLKVVLLQNRSLSLEWHNCETISVNKNTAVRHTQMQNHLKIVRVGSLLRYSRARLVLHFLLLALQLLFCVPTCSVIWH